MIATLLTSGLVLGLSAGLTPGPIMTLVIFQTLKYGVGEGVKVALAPLVTDAPIVFFSLFLLAQISSLKTVLGVLSFVGGTYLLYLAYESIRFKGAEQTEIREQPHSIRKGVVVNFLNPSPYVFWMSIGGPLVLKALQTHIAYSLFFIVPFYGLLVGSKCLLAVVSGKSKGFLTSRFYVYTMRMLGGILIVFALLFFRDGMKYFGIYTVCQNNIPIGLG
jgi:threonine/homoserine/homoserine lactone efflux protein